MPGHRPHDPDAPAGGVLRVHWVPGGDRLLGVCSCGGQREFDDPTELWTWLLAHPDPAPGAAERRTSGT